MNKLITLILILISFTLNLSAQERAIFQLLDGRWQGTLEYQDYKQNRRVTLNVVITYKSSTDGKSAETLTLYDDFGKVYRSEGTESIDPVGAIFREGETQFQIETMETGKLVLLGRTQDGNTVEPTRKTVTLSGDALTILKETRDPWMFRNVYKLKRVESQNEPQQTLTAEQMKADLGVFRNALTTIHPGIYRYLSPTEVETEFHSLESSITKTMPESWFFLKIAQLSSKINCGHTYTNFFNQDAKLRERLFNRRTLLPFYFRIIEGKFIITENASSKKLAVGSEITSINGFRPAEIIAKLLTVTRADGATTTDHRINSISLPRSEAESYALFDWFFPLFFPLSGDVYEIEAVEFGTKAPTKFSVLAMSKEERTSEMAKRYGPTPTFDDGWKFEIQGDKTGYLKINNSITWRLKTVKPKEFLDTAFTELKTKNIKNLIIDLRGNGGGSMDVGFELSRYLTQKSLAPYAESRRLVRNVNAQPDLLSNITTYSDELRESLKSGIPQSMYKKFDDRYFEVIRRPGYPAVEPYPNSFNGKAVIIADSSNASATFQFLDYVQTNKLATIVGQKTGGNKQGINGGNYFFLSLPNSKVEIDIPVFFQAPKEVQKDQSVIPEVLVKTEPFDVGMLFDRELAAAKRAFGTR